MRSFEKVLQWASLKIGEAELMVQLKENYIEEQPALKDYSIGGSFTESALKAPYAAKRSAGME